ncbi:DNA internalization-related competence protein ComEC/Rec2 [Pseudomonas sp. Marseille-QA0892]
MRLALLALAAGLLSLTLVPLLPNISLLTAAIVVAVLLCLTRFFVAGFFLLGFCWACLSAHNALDDRLTAELDGRTLWVEGTIADLPSRTGTAVRFELHDAKSRHGDLPRRMRLSWYGGPDVGAGERWRLAVTLKQPYGLANPAGFDYEAWLLAQRVGATGSVKAGEKVADASGLDAWRDQIRRSVIERDTTGRGGALAALIVGDGSALTPRDWQVLQATGTVHLMVISGHHISIVAGLIYGGVLLLMRRGMWPASVPWLPAACGLALLGAVAYGALAGFGIPVQRACVMTAAVLLWRCWFRQISVWTVLLFALDLVLLWEPLASLQPGFWLSFLAVATLAFAFAGRLGRDRAGLLVWRTQWVVAVGLLPLMLLLSLPVSISAPIANLVAVPVVGLVIVPMALLGCLLLPLPWLGSTLLWLAAFVLKWLIAVLGLLADAVPAWMPLPVPWWGWIMALFGAAWLLTPQGTPGRLLGFLLLVPLGWAPAQVTPDSRADVVMLDVGQGLSVIVRTRHHALLYDAGARLGTYDMGERAVVPTLRAMGIHQLDEMLLSHSDNDHSGGAPYVRSKMPVTRVSSGEPYALPRRLNAQVCGGEEWKWDGVVFSTWKREGTSDSNASSCILRVEANGEAILLTGDLDVPSEMILLDTAYNVDARWLQVGHHGSRTSTGEPFLDAVAPREALMSRGRYNGYGHPHVDVVDRLTERGINILDTADLGAIRFRLGDHGDAISVRDQRRFWR